MDKKQETKMRRLKKLIIRSPSTVIEQNTAKVETSSSLAKTDANGPDLFLSWHQQLKLVAARQQVPDAAELQNVTNMALVHPKLSLRSTPGCSKPIPSEGVLDTTVRQFVETHVAEHGGLRETAVLACQHVCSKATAIELLTSLQRLDCRRYLPCLLDPSLIARGILNGLERAVAADLLILLCNSSAQGVVFGRIILSMNRQQEINPQNSTLLPLSVIRDALTASRFREISQPSLQKLHVERRFKTLYDQIYWLGELTSLPPLLTTLLDSHFPTWPLYNPWRPEYTRLCLREGAHLTQVQKDKLGGVFDLEGPDPTGARRPTLRQSEPSCYDGVRGANGNPMLLDRLAAALDSAIQAGPAVVDMWISRFVQVGNVIVVSEDGLAAFEMMMMADGDDVARSCRAALDLERAMDPSAQLLERLEAIAAALPTLPSSATADEAGVTRIARVVQELVGSAQRDFCRHLDQTRAAHVFGLAIFDVLVAVRACTTWLRDCLDPEFVVLMEYTDFLSRDALETVLEYWEDFGSSEYATSSRQKTTLQFYSLRLLMGGQPVSTELLDLAEQEIRFWTSRPTTDRIDLAGLVSGIETVDYDLYVSCLSRMLAEDDLTIRDLLPSFHLGGLRGARALAGYLHRRRDVIGRPVHECWLALLVCMINAQGPSCLTELADMIQGREFFTFIKNLHSMVGIDNPALGRECEQPGARGMTREIFLWWAELWGKYQPAVRLLLRSDDMDYGGGLEAGLPWLFVEKSPTAHGLLEACRDPAALTETERIVVGFLKPDGSNVSDVSPCLKGIRTLPPGEARNVCESLICRIRGWKDTPGQAIWHGHTLGALAASLRLFPAIGSQDEIVLLLELICTAGGIRLSAEDTIEHDILQTAYQHLSQEYLSLTMESERLEALRAGLQRHHRDNPRHMAEVLERVGVHVDQTLARRMIDLDIPETLVNVVETVENGVYEFCFALTGLSELQRKARGLPDSWRAVVIRLSLSQRFCIHPVDAQDETNTHLEHSGWQSGTNQPRPCRPKCGADMNLFLYGLAGVIYTALQSSQTSLQAVHDAAAMFIDEPPSRCIVCASWTTPKRWRCTTCCQPSCIASFAAAPISVRWQPLLVDALAVDLLLTSLYSAAVGPAPFDGTHLASCPIPDKSTLRAVIESFPPLSELSTAMMSVQNMAQIAGGGGGADPKLAPERVALLDWLLTAFQGFIITTPPERLIPSMPRAIQFCVLDRPPGQEEAWASSFREPRKAGGITTAHASTLVFHGTHPSRLLGILRDGLRVMSGTPGQLNGAAFGPGIYCADEPETSVPYCAAPSGSWPGSNLKDRRVLLACEMVPEGDGSNNGGRGVHVVNNPAQRLAVRWVFMLPPSTGGPSTWFQCPKRRHVETGLMAGFRWIREAM